MTSSDRNENDVPIASNVPATPDVPETEAAETEVPDLSYLVGPLQGLLLLQPVDQGHGWNIFPKDR